MSRIFVPTVLTAAMLSVSHVQAAQAAPSSTPALPTIVVTAGKTPEPIEQVPARISVIDEKTLQQSSVTDLPHLLQRDAALNVVQSGGFGQQTSVFTRGTNSNHTLLLKNGMRLNPSTSGIPNTHLMDTSDLQQIEVLKGPASVQYGSDAIGGVINLITATPKKQRLFTTIEAGEQSTYKATVGADLVQEDAYFQLRGQRLETDGTPALSNVALDRSYDQKGVSAKGGLDNQQYAVSLEVAENKGTSQYIDYDQTTFEHNLPVAQDFLNNLYQLKGRYSLTPQLDVNARISRVNDELDQLNSSDFSHTRHHEADVNVHWRFVEQQNVLLGITHRKTDADYKNGFNEYDKKLKTTGYYLQHQYHDEGVSTQAGIRVEDNQQFGTHTVGQLAGRLQVAPLTSVYANIGTAFRAPDANQLYAGSSANAELKPEQSVSYELGLDQQLNDGLKAYVSAYQTRVKDLINSVCLTAADCSNYIYHNTNVDKARLTGGELGLKWQQDSWFGSAEYAYVQPKDQSAKEELLRRPRQTTTLTAGWDNSVYGLSASLVAKGRSKDFADYPSTTLTTTPGFVTGSVNVFWQVNPAVRVFTNLQNIGDTSYKTAYDGNGVYYIGAPRLATAGITLSH